MSSPVLPRSTVHGVLLIVGLAPAAVLLGRLAYDFGRVDAVIAAFIWPLFAAFVLLGAGHATVALRGRFAPLGTRSRVALVLAIPGALLGTILGCMGLEFEGCTRICGFLMQVWSPLFSALALLFLATRRSALLVLLSALGFGFLVPNCVCRNPINGFWMDLIGYSPACYAAGFGVTLLCLGALRTGRLVAPTLVVVWSTVVVMFAFFIGHHYFHFPW